MLIPPILFLLLSLAVNTKTKAQYSIDSDELYPELMSLRTSFPYYYTIKNYTESDYSSSKFYEFINDSTYFESYANLYHSDQSYSLRHYSVFNVTQHSETELSPMSIDFQVENYSPLANYYYAMYSTVIAPYIIDGVIDPADRPYDFTAAMDNVMDYAGSYANYPTLKVKGGVSSPQLSMISVVTMISLFILLPELGLPLAADRESKMDILITRTGISRLLYLSTWVVYAFVSSLILVLMVIVVHFTYFNLPVLEYAMVPFLVLMVSYLFAQVTLCYIIAFIARTRNYYSIITSMFYTFCILFCLLFSFIVDAETELSSTLTLISPIVFMHIFLKLNTDVVINELVIDTSDLLKLRSFKILCFHGVVPFFAAGIIWSVIYMYKKRVAARYHVMDVEGIFKRHDKKCVGRRDAVPQLLRETAENEHEKARVLLDSGEMPKSWIVLHHVGKIFPPSFLDRAMFWKKKKATVGVRDVSLVLKPGITGLLASSGGGKTTLVSMLTGIHSATRGQIMYGRSDDSGQFLKSSEILKGGISNTQSDNGKASSKRMKNVGLCMQEDTIFPDGLTVREHLRVFQRFHGQKPDDVAIDELLTTLDIDGTRDQKATTLSGGQKRRLCLAIALIVEKSGIIVIDELTSGLDVVSSQQIQDLLIRIGKAQNRTMLVTTHDFQEATRVCDRVVLLRDGYLACTGKPDELAEKLTEDQGYVLNVSWSVEENLDIRVEEMMKVLKDSGIQCGLRSKGLSTVEVDVGSHGVSMIYDLMTRMGKKLHIASWELQPNSLRHVMETMFS